ncbi:hypothetical protein [Bifidobacterium xylocopae]|uniref:Uncharacterized protein n=1 Tax=Bifidobacterium xylocopae TaxID=2493119 RepID=A0A366KFF8_9BIFI|nr:hypothetical protein [Bifidobacterium xylocopae]RBP99833.1 hypothetical protein CRD59_02025 [Bifidobacterium xylocopae]
MQANYDIEQLLIKPQLEQFGEATLDRYTWQSMIATADLLTKYASVLDANGNLPDVVHYTMYCELYEDWAIDDDGALTIVSAKHREADVPHFSSLGQLVDEGGIFHLYANWLYLDQKPQCRLCTSSGVLKDSKRLATICSRLNSPDFKLSIEDNECIDRLLTQLEKTLEAENEKLIQYIVM